MLKKEEIMVAIEQIDVLSANLRKLQYSDPAGSNLGEIKTFLEQQLGKIIVESARKPKEGAQ